MTVYTFTAAVDSLDLKNTELLDALYSEDIGVYPSSIAGFVTVRLVLEAESGEEAVMRGIRHLRDKAPEVRIVRLEEDLVNATEVGDRLDVSREIVRLWSTGARREGFPKPRTVIPGGMKLWTWASVYAWAEATGKLPDGDPSPVDDACIDWFNGEVAKHLSGPYGLSERVGTAAPSPFVTSRKTGITRAWHLGASQPDLDEFQGRDGARWVHDGRHMLKTANRLRSH